MNRWLACIACILLSAVCAAHAAPVAAPAATPAPPIPADTQVLLSLDERIDSDLVHTGQHFALTVSQDVLVDGAVVVPKGARAQGTVLFARKKGHGRSGALDLRVDFVEAPAGRVPVRASLSRRSRYIAPEHAADHVLVGLGLTVEMGSGENIVLEPGTSIEVAVVAQPGPQGEKK